MDTIDTTDTVCIEHAYQYEGCLVVLEPDDEGIPVAAHVTLHDGLYSILTFGSRVTVKQALDAARDQVDLLVGLDNRTSFATEHLQLQHDFLHGSIMLAGTYED